MIVNAAKKWAKTPPRYGSGLATPSNQAVLAIDRCWIEDDEHQVVAASNGAYNKWLADEGCGRIVRRGLPLGLIGRCRLGRVGSGCDARLWGWGRHRTNVID
jgi:hypothetical protein